MESLILSPSALPSLSGLDVGHFVRREGSAHRLRPLVTAVRLSRAGVGDHLRFGWVDSIVAGDGDGGVDGVDSFELADRGFIRVSTAPAKRSAT
jgi:hypothetical protein